MGMTVITYGGSTILQHIFDAIAMLMNRHGGIVQPLMIICATIGCLWAAAKAFFSHSFQAFVRSYIFPLIAISFVFLIPTTSVKIEDVLKNKSYTVDHVPFLLAKFAQVVSSIGYRITEAFETVMHVPNDLSYNETGMLFGAENALEIDRYEITNADLEQNLKRFCHHCMLYDVALGRYSLNDLKISTDLWKFLEEKTSKVRSMQFISLDSAKEKHETDYVSCQKAIQKMTPYFEKEKKFYANQEVIKNLPLTFQAITGIQKEKTELISQQLMMNLLTKEWGGEDFAKSRAYTQQKNTAWILGSLASNSLITLRGVLEALVYAAFILIFPLAFLPKGINYITTWAGLVVWIQLWPPFYAILNYIMQLVAHGYAENIFGRPNELAGLSFFSSIGIRKMQEDIFAVSGCLAASIPFITYAILKGGVSSFVHLAGSMMSPAHSASAAVASEQSTGNLAFCNASLGQISYQNTQALQTQIAPSLSSGYFSENTGSYGIVHTPDGKILNQSNSSLRTSFFSDDSLIQSQQEMKQHALSSSETAQKNYMENLGVASREFTDLVSSLGKSSSQSEGWSSREAADTNESVRYFENTAESYAHQHGMSVREGFEKLMHAGLSASVGVGGTVCKFLSASFSGNAGIDWRWSQSSSKDESWNAALSIAKGEDFQRHLQHIQDISETKGHSLSNDEALRHSEGFNHSFEKTKNAQESLIMAESELNQISENSAWLQQNSQHVKDSLNQEFVDFYAERFADSGGVYLLEDVLSKGSSFEKQQLVNEFLTHMRTKMPGMELPENFRDPTRAFETSNLPALNAEREFSDLKSSMNLTGLEMPAGKSGLPQKFSKDSHDFSEKIHALSGKIGDQREEARSAFGKPGGVRIQGNLGSFQIKEEPFWLRKEEGT